MPRRAIDGEKAEARFWRKRRRATAVAATGGVQAPGAEAQRADTSENDDFDERQPQLLKKQHATVRRKKVQAYLDGKLLDKEESGDVKAAAEKLKLRREGTGSSESVGTAEGWWGRAGAALERRDVLGGQLRGVRRAAASTAHKMLLVDGESG